MTSAQVSHARVRPAFWSPKESFLNMFRWRQHLVYTDSAGIRHERWDDPEPLPNPFKVWSGLTLRGFLAAQIGFWAAFTDAFDFHGMGIQTVKLAKWYGVSKAQMSTAVTVTMLCRILGAIICGVWSDWRGRKWTLAYTLWFLAIIQVATVYSRTFQEFLAVRALFGVGMGGVYGCAASLAFEEIPAPARGIFSGIFQAAYPLAYLLGGVINLIVGGEAHTWPTMFWVGAGMSFLVGLARAVFPEANNFTEAMTETRGQGTRRFWRNLVTMLRTQWPTVIYATWFICWYSVFGHGTQDAYVTFLIDSKGFTNAQASRNIIVSKVGSVFGSIFIAYISQSFGRRRTMALFYLLTTLLLPAYVLPKSESGLMAGAFWNQLTGAAWAVVPIWLQECAHPSFRSLATGSVYMLGVMLSSPATQVVNILGESHRVPGAGGKLVEAYGPVIAGVGTIAAVLCMISLAFGPERLGRAFEKASPAVLEGAAAEELDYLDEKAVATTKDPQLSTVGGDTPAEKTLTGVATVATIA